MCRRFLVVSTSRENVAAFRSIEGETLSGNVTEAYSGAEARRLLAERLFINVVIDAPLSDEPGAELALYAASRCSGGVILFAKRSLAAELMRRSAGRCVIVIPKPVDRAALRLALQALDVMRVKLAMAEEENIRLRMRLSDEKIICRAKCLLVRDLNISEEEAHRYIEKMAMNNRRSKREVAEEIVSSKATKE